jgi:SAM-dependent methyltransferase
MSMSASATNKISKTEENPLFPYLREFASETQIPAENLIRVFQIESEFHRAILATDNPAKRKAMYAELYSTVHPLLRPTSQINDESIDAIPSRAAQGTVLLFRRELSGKSVLDVGCGDGKFLFAIHSLLPHGALLGLDTDALWQNHRTPLPPDLQFLRQDIVSFRLDRTFDVVFSNQVLEHLAPSDLSNHLRSIHDALAPGGRFIVLLPNRLWGPGDITRIVDNTYTGRIAASGSHLNESTYSELIPILLNSGFRSVQTALPFAHALPPFRSLRVTPWLNQLLERNEVLLTLVRSLRRHGRPIFRNMIILVCS